MLVNVVAAVALSSLPMAPAPAEPAPADVRLAWVSSEHKEFAVTWNETGDVRNKIELVWGDGSPTGAEAWFAEAGQPNRVTIGTALPYGQDLRMRVTVVDAEGAALSEPADSPVFDTDYTPVPIITSAVPAADGSIRLTWVPGAYTDRNPGDPLDLPAGTEPRYQPVASRPDFNEYLPVGEEVRGTGTVVIKGQKAPVSVGLRSVNEWYARATAVVAFDGTKVTAQVPAKATIGGKLTVTGTAIKTIRACDPGPCMTMERPFEGRELQLQTRASKTAAWRTVATTVSAAAGKFKFSTAFAGTSDFRVVALPVAWTKDTYGIAYAETPAKTVTGVTAPAPGTGTGGDGEPDDGGAGGGLPITGAPVTTVALAGALLVAAGAGLARAGRLRRRRA